MRTFQFSLQRVLDLRTYQRTQAEQKLASIRRKQQQHKAEARQIQSRMEAAAAELPDGANGPADFRRRAAHRESIRQRYREIMRRLDELQEAERDARRRLVERRRAEETLESLYDKEKNRYETDQRRSRQRQMDEQAVVRHVRGNNS